MSVAEALRVLPGTVIKTYKPKGFLQSDEIKRTIVGSPKAGIIPVGVREPEDVSNRFYTTINLSDLKALSGEKGTRVEPNQDITIQERNIIKLWDCDLLWDHKSEQAKLKEGVILWATFNNDEQILDLSLEKPEDKSPQMSYNRATPPELSSGQTKFPPLRLKVTDNHLYICMNHRVPPTISYQIDVLNWLLVP